MRLKLMAFLSGLVFLTVNVDAKDTALERRVRIASEVVTNRMESPRPIPDSVVAATKCVASLKVVKVGFMWGGEGSTGLVSCRTPEGWSAPSFFNVGGVNFGIQIGVQFIESVLTFMTNHAREILERGTFEIGADLSFAAGPVGTGGGVGVIPEAHILNYQKTVGLYAGATVGGFILTHDPRRNEAAYGTNIAPYEILATPGATAPQLVQPFVEVLERHLR